MHEIDLKSIDLNLLVILDVLLEERSVSKAAHRIGRTQSATSHALGRLRETLNDPLLVRVGSDMVPTPRAERLKADLRRVLRSLRRVLEGEDEFDAAHSDRIFSLAGPDFLAIHCAAIVTNLRDHAPNARLDIIEPGPHMFQDLVDARLDVIVSPPPRRIPEGIVSEPICRLEWVVFARRNHPGANKWSLRTWRRYDHIQVRTRAERSPVEIALEAKGRTRTVAAWLPSFHVAAALIAQTDLLFTAPRAVLGHLASQYDLMTLKCPLDLQPVPLLLHRAIHLSRDPAVSFFSEIAHQTLVDAFSMNTSL